MTQTETSHGLSKDEASKSASRHPALEELRGKWLASVFDKVVLGIVVAAGLAFIQARLTDQQKQVELVRQAAINVANVNSGLLSEERKVLSDRVTELISVLADAGDFSKALAFTQALVAVQAQVWKAEAVFHGLWPADPVNFNPFRRVIFDLDREWFKIRQAIREGQQSRPQLIGKFQDTYRRRISEAYVDLVRAMQVAIVEAAKSDARLAIGGPNQ